MRKVLLKIVVASALKLYYYTARTLQTSIRYLPYTLVCDCVSSSLFSICISYGVFVVCGASIAFDSHGVIV